MVCPAFPANGRTVFLGHLFVRDRLLSESGMEKHPLTPMTDPDIRRWLARQTQVEVGHLALAALRRDPQAALATLAAEGPRLIVADAIEDEDLFRLGRLARGHRLVTGGSGIAMGLPANFGIEARRTAFFAGVEGPAIVLSGSCSAATLAQVDRYRSTHPALQLEAEQALSPEQTLAQVAAFLDRHRNAGPLVYSSASPEAVRAAQARFGRERLASAYDRLFAEIAAAAVRDGFTRIVVGGGETSGAVAEALGVNALDIGPEIDPGVPALATTRRAAARRGVEIGQFRRRRLLCEGRRHARNRLAMNVETELRAEICLWGRSLFERGYTAGSSGNMSARLDDGFLFTPTNSCLGFLEPDRLAKLDLDGRHLSGDAPTKELPLHLAFYEARPQAGGVVHLHSTYATALSCLEGSIRTTPSRRSRPMW